MYVTRGESSEGEGFLGYEYGYEKVPPYQPKLDIF